MKGKKRNIFPGGNTPKGFYSYYNYILPQKKAEKIFCIKGGPGLGKSTFMKSVGNYFLDRGENVDFLWCSSDPDSLDGILIKERAVAIIDATAPHIVDPKNPGAVDEIINLGDFWNEDMLRDNKDAIIECGKNIKGLFDITYGYLKCASYQYEFMWEIISDLIAEEEIDYIIDELTDKLTAGKEKKAHKGIRKKSFAGAITPRGFRNGLDSLTDNMDKLIKINVPIGFKTETILKPLSDKLVRIYPEIEEYYCPMDPESKIEHIIIPSDGLAVICCNDYHGKDLRRNITEEINITLDRKKDKLRSSILRELQKTAAKNIADAVTVLEKAKNCHDKLEEYYIPSMDFNKMEKLRERIIDRIDKL